MFYANITGTLHLQHTRAREACPGKLHGWAIQLPVRNSKAVRSYLKFPERNQKLLNMRNEKTLEYLIGMIVWVIKPLTVDLSVRQRAVLKLIEHDPPTHPNSHSHRAPQ